MYLWDIKQVFGLLTKIGLEAAPAACCLLVAIVISFGRYLTHRLNTPRKEEGKDATDMKTHSDDIRGQRKAEPGQSVRRQRDRRKKIQCKGNSTTQARADEWRGRGEGNSQWKDWGFWGRRNGNAGDKHATGKGQKSALWGVANRKSFNQRKRKKKTEKYIYKEMLAKATNYTFSVYFVFIESSRATGLGESKNEISKK